jgi:hypothetical protein
MPKLTSPNATVSGNQTTKSMTKLPGNGIALSSNGSLCARSDEFVEVLVNIEVRHDHRFMLSKKWFALCKIGHAICK